MIDFRDISFAYRSSDGDVAALSSVSLELRDGELHAVLGANGSGKSTLTLMGNGLLLPDSGTVTVDGVDTAEPGSEFVVRTSVGLVMQNPEDQIVATDVASEVAFGPENLGLPRHEIRARVAEALEAVGLSGMDDREPHTLSGGQKQRLAIASALAMRPRHLVLDEPTSMLDPAGRDDVVRILGKLRASGVAVLVVTHRIEDVADADRVSVLSFGRLEWTGGVRDLLDGSHDLPEWGLEPPPVSTLVGALADRGVALDRGELHTARIAEALCR